MPRRLFRLPRRRELDHGDLDEELRSCLERWEGCLGVDPALRMRDDWASAWSRWSGDILPKFRATFPGCRPAAMYACGLVPRRPLVETLPPGHGFVAVFVGERDGGQWHYQAWEPFQRCEGAWLLEQGVIDRAEYRRHLRSERAHGWRCLYPWAEGGVGRRHA